MSLLAFDAKDMLYAQPCWLYVAKCGKELIVYQSVLTREDSDMYQPVKEMINGHRLVDRTELFDESMMFGRAVELRYEEE